MDAVAAELTGRPGVEIHASEEDGRFIVTVDGTDERDVTDTLTWFGTLEGILSTSLVYTHFEEDPAQKGAGK
jgi:periplasmic nitrate reductase NapD